MTKKIQFTIGISASGKSSWARNEWMIKGNLPIERDLIRAIIQLIGLANARDICDVSYYMHAYCKGDLRPDWKRWKWKNEGAVTEIQRRLVEGAFSQRDINGVIISDTNLNPQRLQNFKDFAVTIGYEVSHDMLFECSLEDAWQNDAGRAGGVGHSVIFQQWLTLERQKSQPLILEAMRKRKPGKLIRQVVVFDVDGTLARAHTRDIYDWSKVIEDEPIPEIVSIAHALIYAGKTLVVVSGRDGVCKKDTVKWLSGYDIQCEEVFMRPKDDMRRDTIVKKEIYLEKILPKYDVEMVFDDRPSVVRMWQSMGVPTCAVGTPHLEF